jgi:hypothetical protein
MSEIKVNKISPKQLCTQLTLGDSGDTIIIPAGATITNNGTATGFGRTGTVNWDTTKKTTGFTAVNGVGYFCDTTSAAFTMTLPATPSAGDIVALKDYANTFDTNNLTIGRNGSKINGLEINAVISVQGQSLTLIYIDATQGWSAIYGATDSDLPVPLYIAATGGTVTTCGDYKIHSFTGPGTFTVSCAGNSAGSNTVQTLIVAGGGGGGRDRGSGGGAGGLILTPSAGIPVSATAYPISIGGGGPGGTSPFCGTQGTPTTGFSLTSVGGGKGSGGGGAFPVATTTGGPGGSGGGGSVGCTAPSVGPGGPGTQPTQPGNSGAYGFGNNGGAANPSYPTGTGNTGGGGGAGAVGVAGSSSVSGAGGAGKDVTSIFGASPKAFYGPTNGIYAGGGGGGMSSGAPGGPTAGGLGGSGGGGPGGKSPANGPGPGVGTAGTANTGGGGGGGANTTPTQCGAGGGSGIVLIRYKFQ